MAEPSAEREILDYERAVNEALRRNERSAYYEPATTDTPLYAMMASEEGDADEWAIRTAAIRLFFAYLTGDGPHPANILRRAFALGIALGMEPFISMPPDDRALMFGDEEEAVYHRLKLICSAIPKGRKPRNLDANSCAEN